MKALIRLAHKQGLFDGDLNDVRQLALASLMGWEMQDQVARDDSHLRAMIIAYHLGDAKKILEAIDGAQKEEEFAPELTEEEMENYQPLSVEETSAAIEQLRKFGLAVE